MTAVLARREAECLALYRSGERPTDIAKQLGLSHKTVCTYLTRAQKKLQCKNRFELRRGQETMP